MTDMKKYLREYVNCKKYRGQWNVTTHDLAGSWGRVYSEVGGTPIDSV